MSTKIQTSDPRFLKLLKVPKKDQTSEEEDLFSNPASSNAVDTPDLDNLLTLSEGSHDVDAWTRKKTPDPEFKPAVRLFNLVNLEKNPQAESADQLTLTTLKGTSFEDKRETCLEFVHQVRTGEHSGEVELIHSPYEDQINPERNDPWAIKVCPKGYPEEKFIGYIPKAHQVNESFCKAIQNGRFCGAHLIATKSSNFGGSRNQIITIACGWKSKENPSS